MWYSYRVTSRRKLCIHAKSLSTFQRLRQRRENLVLQCWRLNIQKSSAAQQPGVHLFNISCHGSVREYAYTVSCTLLPRGQFERILQQEKQALSQSSRIAGRHKQTATSPTKRLRNAVNIRRYNRATGLTRFHKNEGKGVTPRRQHKDIGRAHIGLGRRLVALEVDT